MLPRRTINIKSMSIIPTTTYQRGNSCCAFLIRICSKNYRRREYYSSWASIETFYAQRITNRTIYTNRNSVIRYNENILLLPYFSNSSSSYSSTIHQNNKDYNDILNHQTKRTQQSIRSNSSSSSSSNSTNVTPTSTTIITIQLPEPTWSVNSLELNKNHKPMNYNELKVLAKRAIIDLHYLSNTTNKMNINTLCQDLGNMMHMIQNITITTNNEQQQNDDKILTCQDIYDRPRGVTTAPIRTTTHMTETKTKNDTDNNTIQAATNDNINCANNENDQINTTSNNNNKNDDDSSTDVENIKLWDQYIKPTKMKRIGGHYYFVIPTKIEKK